MNILFITPIDTYYIDRNIENLINMGHKVRLVNYKFGDNIFEKIKNIFLFIKEIIKESKKKYDLINVQYPFIAAIPLSIIKLNSPLVVTLHGSDAIGETSLKERFTRFIIKNRTKKLMQRAEAVTVNTKQYLEEIEKNYNISLNNFHIIPTAGYNKDYFYPDFSIEKNNDLLFVGRLVEGKGIDLFLEIIDYYEKKQKNMKITIVGKGPFEEEIINLQTKLKAKNSPVNLVYYDKLEQKSLGELYRKSKLFIFPTRYKESLGLVGVEALACATPVIGANIGGLQSYIKNEYNGYLVEDDYKNYIYMIDKYYNLSDSDKLIMKKNAIESIKNFEKDYVSTEFNNLLVKVKEEYNGKI